MEFSESYKASLGPCAPEFSPNGEFVAVPGSTGFGSLIIREVDSLRVVQLYSCLDRITGLAWSPNSLYVLCALGKRAMVQIWSVDQPDWTCKIDEGPAGIGRVLWAPDGLNVLVLSQFQIRIAVWSLMDRKCTYLRGPKHAENGLAFSPDGAILAVLERYKCKDNLTLYSTKDWQQLSHQPCETSDAADLAWSANGRYLAIWDSCLTYRVVVHDAEGAHVAAYSAYQDVMGVRCGTWNPTGDLLAVGSFDQVVRVLNSVTWLPLMECSHPDSVTEPPHAVVYREASAPATSPLLSPSKALASRQACRQFVVSGLPANIPTVTPNYDSPQLGIVFARWSPDSQFLVTHNGNQPTALWIWDMAAMELSAVLLTLQPITDAQWSPKGNTLAAVTGQSTVYMWTPAGACIVHVPLKAFSARGLSWAPLGGALALTDLDSFCCAYPSQ